MKDAKFLINALQQKNKSISSGFRNKGKVNIKFKSFLTWLGWFGGGGGYPGFQQKLKK